MKKYTLCSTMALLALAACHPNSSGNPDTMADPTVAEMRTEATTNTKPLSASDKAALKNYFAQAALVVPDVSLYLDQYSQSDAGKKSKGRDLAKLNDKGRALVDRVKAKCKIDPGHTDTGAETAAEKAKHTSYLKTLSSITEDASMAGQCPVAFSKTAISLSDSPLQTDVKAGLTGKWHYEEESSMIYSDPEVAKNPNANANSKSLMDADYQAILTDSEGKVTGGSMAANFRLISNGKTSDGQTIELSIRGKMISSPGYKTLQYLAKLSGLSGVAPVVLAIFKTDQLPAEVVINGENFTETRAKDELGIDFSSF